MTTLQDEERRRLARELHDSVGQLLAAMSMNSVFVEAKSHKLSPAAAKRVYENAAMVKEATKEIRTISHLLHPPLLDEVGLASAIRCLSKGSPNAARSTAKLDITKNLQVCQKKWNSRSFGLCRSALPIFIAMLAVPRLEFALSKMRLV